MRGKHARRHSLLGLPLLLLCASILIGATGTTRAVAAAGACPNEGLRLGQAGAGLPDCRAFEQATPLDKGGIDADGEAPIVRAASGGGAVTFLAGTSGTPLQEYTPSLAARRGEAWSAEPLLTPTQVKGGSETIGMTPDLAWVFVRAADREAGPPVPAALLARSTGDGTVRTIVPPTPGFAPRFVGASEDGSLVAFEAPQALPGLAQAIPGKPNLYGWDRASGEVRLLGILNDGSAPAEGAIGGSYDWVRGTTDATLAEGGATRGYYTQDQHTVSAAGSAVYFTAAGSGRLYLRRNPFAAQSPLDAEGACTNPSLACTVEVSSSRKTNGSGPGGVDPEGPAPAAFMGASADGGRSFFTSTEDLTDDATTGVSQISPGIVRARVAGGIIEPGFLSAPANGIAVDGSHVYWANPARGSIGRARIDGSGVEEDFVSGIFSPRWVAVDGEYLYWTSSSTASEEDDGAIGRVRLDRTGPPEPDFIAAAGEPQGIAVDAAHIYWANGFAHAISRAGIDGDEVEPSFHFIGSSEVAQGVAVDGSHVYWTTNNPNGYISRSELDGSNEIFSFIGGLAELRGIAIDAGHVYWSAEGSQAIGRSNLGLEEVEREFVPQAGRAAGLAVDASRLYWVTADIESSAKDLYRYDAGSDELSDLTPDPDEANGAEVLGVLGLSADGSRVYFAANGVLADGVNDRGESAQPGTCRELPGSSSGSCNLYLADGATIEFIARLQIDGDPAESDAANWAATPTAIFHPGFQQTARVSADGRTLLFRSSRRLTDYANEGTPELYLYRAGGGGVTCVSCNPSGAAPLGPPTFGTIFPPTEFGGRPAAARTRSLSADGKRVFFESVDPLVGADRNGEGGCPPVGFLRQQFPACQDVYEWEAAGVGSCAEATAEAGCLYLLSTAEPARPALFADASADGGEAFIFSAASLVGQDRDELFDVYDARVDGGLAAQGAPVAGCSGEACRPPASAPAAAEALGTESSAAPPARRRPRRCSRHGRAGHGRCKHPHRHRHR